MKTSKSIEEILKDKFPGRRFGVQTEGEKVIVFYDAYMPETEVNKLQDYLDSLERLNIKVEMHRMEF